MIDLFNIESTMFLREPAELLTILVSFMGLFIGLWGFVFFSYSKKPLSRKMRFEYLTDAGVFFVTLVMGIGLYFNLHSVIHYDVILRPLILLLNVIAGYRLIRHFISVK